MGHVFCQGYCWKGKERGNLSEIVLALDTEDLASADRMLELLGSKLKFVKIGPRLFYLGGRNFVMSLKKQMERIVGRQIARYTEYCGRSSFRPRRDGNIWIDIARGRRREDAARGSKEARRSKP